MKHDAAPARERSAINVLVVDDTIDSRLSLSSLLRVVGHTVYEASDAQQALTILQSPMPIDVLVTDVEMPGPMNGLGLAEHVRTTHPRIVVVVVSGRDFASQIRDPGVLFLGKPYDSERLLSHIERLDRS